MVSSAKVLKLSSLFCLQGVNYPFITMLTFQLLVAIKLLFLIVFKGCHIRLNIGEELILVIGNF